MPYLFFRKSSSLARALGVALASYSVLAPMSLYAEDYTIKELPSTFRASTRPGALNDRNQVAGTVSLPNPQTGAQERFAALWNADTETVQQRGRGEGSAVNNEGIMVGLAITTTPGQEFRPGVYLPNGQDIVIQNLPTPLNQYHFGSYGVANALGINANGDIIVQADSGPLEGVFCPSTGTCVNIQHWEPGNVQAYPRALDDQGRVIGPRFIWTPAGGAQPVPAVQGFSQPILVSMNNQGELLANATSTSGLGAKFLTFDQNLVATVSGDQIGDFVGADISDDGTIVGYQRSGTVTRAIRSQEQVSKDLNLAVSEDFDGVLSNAYSVNNVGAILAAGRNAANEPRTYLLLPIVPEPDPAQGNSEQVIGELKSQIQELEHKLATTEQSLKALTEKYKQCQQMTKQSKKKLNKRAKKLRQLRTLVERCEQ